MREPIRQFNPDQLIELLHEHYVDYILVGGYAGLLHGSTRPTMDLDVVPAWNQANLERLCTALRQVNARAITGPPCEGKAITTEVLIEREIMTWATDLGRVDTMVGIPDSEGLPVSYHDLAPRAEAIPVADIVVEVASLDDIITSKEFAGRSKDTRALPELRYLREGGSSTSSDI